MKLDAALWVDAAHMRDAATIARAADAIGFDGLWTVETKHNGFFPLLLAAEHSQRIELGTAVAIAFPRSPLVVAQIAWDLQSLSSGRFILGLGTQVRAHRAALWHALGIAGGQAARLYWGAARDLE